MPTVDIDEVELQRYKTLETTVQGLLKNPKARRKLLEAQKEAHPDLSIPELDAEKPVQDEITKLRTELDEDRKLRAKEKEEEKAESSKKELNAKWEEGRLFARQNGYNEEGLKALEDFMQKEGVFSHRIGMAAFEKEHPQEQVIASSTDWNFFEQPEGDGKDLMSKMLETKGEDDSILRKMTQQALTDTRSAQRR
jgi:hypothetical protein